MSDGAKTGTPAEQAAFEEWLVATCPSGDAEAVHRQWRESSDYDDFLEHHPLWSTMRSKLDDLLRDETSNTYVCGRVWHAWSVGTMSEDDFKKFDSGDRIEQLVYEVEAICEERIQQEKSALADALTEALKVAGELAAAFTGGSRWHGDKCICATCCNARDALAALERIRKP